MGYKEKPFRLCLRFQSYDAERKETSLFRAVFNALGIKQDLTETYGKGFDGNTQLLNFGFDSLEALNDAVNKIKKLLPEHGKSFEEVEVKLPKPSAPLLQRAVSLRIAAPS